jgi:hypothetical protein
MVIMSINSNIRNARPQLPVFGAACAATVTAIADYFRIDRRRIFEHLNEP